MNDVNKTYRLGAHTVFIVKALAEKYGISQRGLIEQAVEDWRRMMAANDATKEQERNGKERS